jgi:hypothetical protein
MREPSPERRRWAWGASMFERLLYVLKDELKAAREDRPPVDSAVSLRRKTMGATVAVIYIIGWGVFWVVLAKGAPGKIFGIVIATIMVSYLVRELVVGTRRTKRVRGPSDPLSREVSMTGELLAERRAEAAREDRGPE